MKNIKKSWFLFNKLIVFIAAILLLGVLLSPVFAKQHSWKQASERGALEKDLIYFDNSSYILQGPLIRNNHQRLVGIVLYCDTRRMIIFSFIDNSFGQFVVF